MFSLKREATLMEFPCELLERIHACLKIFGLPFFIFLEKPLILINCNTNNGIVTKKEYK